MQTLKLSTQIDSKEGYIDMDNSVNKLKIHKQRYKKKSQTKTVYN